MNLNKKKHELLKILFNRRTQVELNYSNDKVLGVSFENIMKDLNCSESEMYTISSELITNGEIEYHNAHNVKGYFAKQTGMTAYTNKKYLEISNQILIDRAKNIVQILIPILSLIIALVAILIKVDTINTKNETEMNNIKKEINSLKEQIKDKSRNKKFSN